MQTRPPEKPVTDHAAGKVLHVFDHSFPKGDGYAYRSGEILRAVRRLGWQTVHVTSAKQGRTAADKESAGGFEFYRTQPAHGLLSRLPFVKEWSFVTQLRRRLDEVIRIERPDIIHAYSPCINALAAIPLARRYGIPLIYEVRAIWEDGAVDSGVSTESSLRYRFSRALETYTVHRVKRVVTICEGLRTEMIGRGVKADEITSAPNCVDLARFGSELPRDEALAARLGLKPGKTFGFIGSFFPYEGLEVLLRAVPAIREREPEARFLLVGDGQVYKRVQELVRSLGIGDVVTLTGRVPHEDVERYYGLLDILVYPRIPNRVTELVTPLKPLEAMAQRKLVIASDVGGLKEMVFEGKTGTLFRAGDPASLAQACLNLLRTPESWPILRERARQYVATERNWALNGRIYDELYRGVLTV